MRVPLPTRIGATLTAASATRGATSAWRLQRVDHAVVPAEVRRKRNARRDEENAGRHGAERGPMGSPLVVENGSGEPSDNGAV